MNKNDDLTPPLFNTWAVKDTGFEEGSKLTPRSLDWTEVLLGENTRRCNSKAFKNSRILEQGKACVKYYRVMYKLDEKIERPNHIKVPKAEKRKAQNRKRTLQRRERDRRLREEARQQEARQQETEASTSTQ